MCVANFSGSICSGATIHDLDEHAIEVFREKWSEKSDLKRIKNLSNEQLLQDCEAITLEGITFAALALFGKRSSLGKFLPQSEIIFEYRSSDASGPAQQREEFRVGFFACIVVMDCASLFHFDIMNQKFATEPSCMRAKPVCLIDDERD